MSFGSTDQENLLAILAFDDSPGGCLVAAQMLPDTAWDTHYSKIFGKLSRHVTRFGESPGEHTFELIEQLCAGEPDNAEAYRDIFRSMAAAHEGGLNREYVYNRAQTFGRHSRLRHGIGEALTHLKTVSEEACARAELALTEARSSGAEAFTIGLSTHDAEGVARAATDRPDEPFMTGIPEFDDAGIGPARKELYMLGGAYGSGKSFGLGDLGLAASVLSRVKVLHIPLEMSAAKTMRRYVQRMFGYGTRAETVRYTRFIQEGGKLLDFDFDSLDLRGLYDDDAYGDILRRAKGLRRRTEIRIKGFKSGSLTISQLEAYLDYLYGETGFVPDLIVLDYIQIMKILKVADKRAELGQIAIELRGLADHRNCAIATAVQLNRDGIKSAMSRGSQLAEDISAAHTADRLVIYNQSEAEKEIGVARLWVDKARDARDGFEVLISQSYAAGQFRIDSMLMDTSYDEVLERLKSAEAV